MSQIWMIGFLTLIWGGFSNDFTPANVLLGLLVAALCCRLLPSQHKRYHIRPWALFSLLNFTALELIKSSLLVAWDVLTPQHLSSPKILDIPLICQHDAERTLLANLLSLTPGTLSIDLNPEKTHLKVHAMFADEPGKIIDFVSKQLEPRVLKVFKYADT
jgi:multicomponent Na+:H+ antiporter subunit E